MKIKTDVDPDGALGRLLLDLERKQIPFAASVAINRTANGVRDAWRKQIEHKLDSPRPFTVNAPMVKHSNKRDLVADVFLRDQAKDGRAPAQYLLEQVLGGSRRRKAFETAITNSADALGLHGLVATPGKNAAIDAQGNQSNRQTREILNALQKGDKAAGIFALFNTSSGRQPGKLRPGVYRRLKRRGKGKPGQVRILNAFVRPGRYRARLDIYEAARKVVGRRFGSEFTKAFTAATDDALKRALDGLKK